MKVLFATDGSAPAGEAQRLIARLAHRDRVEIDVVSVNSFEMSAHASAVAGLDHYSPEAGDKRATEIVQAAVDGLKQEGFAPTGIVAEGEPGLEILHAIERDWYDLTVCASGSTSWLGSFLLGSTSTYILHGAPSSVMIVHRAPAEDRPVRVLVGADGSRGSEFALRTIAGFADPSRCRMTVSSVLKPPVLDVPRLGALSEERADELGEVRHTSQAERYAEHAANLLRDAGFEVETYAAFGHPVEELLGMANSQGADLICVGARGRNRFKRTPLGSVGDKIVRHAPAALIGRRVAI